MKKIKKFQFYAFICNLAILQKIISRTADNNFTWLQFQNSFFYV